VASRSVLVVEDHPLNLQLVRDLLVAAGYDVLHAGTAEAGLVSARQDRPDLILMDLALPGMDGLEATRLLKLAPETRAIPVIALTAHAMKADVDRARQVGCDGFLAKPIGVRSLLSEIARHLPRADGAPWHSQPGAPVRAALESALESDHAGAAGDGRRRRLSLARSSWPAAKAESLAALAGGIAHELGNTLAASLLAIDLLRRSQPSSEPRQALAALDEATHHAIDLVQQMAWLAAGADNEVSAFHPKHLLDGIARLLRASLPAGTTILADCPPEVWLLSGRLDQVYLLLVSLCRSVLPGFPDCNVLRITARNRLVEAPAPATPSGAALAAAHGRVVFEIAAEHRPGTRGRLAHRELRSERHPAAERARRLAREALQALGGSGENLERSLGPCRVFLPAVVPPKA
jgi:two-component system cell cycle response regulator DivK